LRLHDDCIDALHGFCPFGCRPIFWMKIFPNFLQCLVNGSYDLVNVNGWFVIFH